MKQFFFVLSGMALLIASAASNATEFALVEKEAIFGEQWAVSSQIALLEIELDLLNKQIELTRKEEGQVGAAIQVLNQQIAAIDSDSTLQQNEVVLLSLKREVNGLFSKYEEARRKLTRLDRQKNEHEQCLRQLDRQLKALEPASRLSAWAVWGAANRLERNRDASLIAPQDPNFGEVGLRLRLKEKTSWHTFLSAGKGARYKFWALGFEWRLFHSFQTFFELAAGREEWTPKGERKEKQWARPIVGFSVEGRKIGFFSWRFFLRILPHSRFNYQIGFGLKL